MNKIGFQNFRRFQHLEPLEYRGITFLVGRNNAGKSTLVKALLLIDNYFKAENFNVLTLGNDILENANIVTYGRAKNTLADENYIYFYHEVEGYSIGLTISGEDDKSFAFVHKLIITDLNQGITFLFDIQNKFLNIYKEWGSSHTSINLNPVIELENIIEEIKKQIKTQNLKKTSKEYIELVSSLEKEQNRLDKLNSNLNFLKEPKQTFSLYYYFEGETSLLEIVEEFLNDNMRQYRLEFDKLQKGEPTVKNFDDLRALKEIDPIFVESSFRHFSTLVGGYTIAYMGANPAKQSALFAIRDKNNALAQAINEYKQLNILDGDEEYLFVKKWMNEFEVGLDFKIEMLAGEAYQVKIISNNKWIHLADKGMGSIQAMLLVIRIACVIRKIKLTEKASTNSNSTTGIKRDSNKYLLIDKTTVIIEEPELNLHPALQSKLADLFLEVHKKHQIDFLIETHSEYILRRSQVLVAENEFEVAPNENPFCVHYFPNEANMQPYMLEYEINGRFKRNFGEGFFDEATKSTMTLLKFQRAKS